MWVWYMCPECSYYMSEEEKENIILAMCPNCKEAKIEDYEKVIVGTEGDKE